MLPLWASVSLLVLAQAQETRSPIAVVVSSKRPNADTHSAKVATKLVELLRKEGIGPLLDDAAATRELRAAGFADPKSCAGGSACVAKLAVLLGSKAVVIGVDVGKVSKSLAIHLEAMSADSEEALASADFVAPADKWAEKSAAPMAQFIAQLKPGLALKKRTAVAETKGTPDVSPSNSAPAEPRDTGFSRSSDAPRQADLEPKAVRDDALVATKSGGKPAKTAAWVVAGGAVAAAVAAGTFAGLGFADKAAFDSKRIDLGGGLQGSQLTQSQAQALAGSANTKLTVAVTTGIVSAALAGVSVVLFTRD